ncbi:substrate-binding periplasmic protein [Shimia marina]|uniref:Bacterial extracellular solute-binding proteins, family 3 n=1 Tax=Shimia marina TaxID=321267 RepID=A0A0P1ERX8_9RHOB|nr:ABC transporter substrate-binding protein [Shimia marina]CUH52848.1 Bacterial extracellular solute-binding proteins, family 3 [Shimia marina]SFD88815.1 amino acid ABC transporter substrate-binding protein, PAAT family [Shimia marina]
MLKSTCFLAAAAALTAAVAQAETVQLTTLEWPPYVNADASGTSTEAVSAAFAAAGDEVVAEVLPWNRAVNLAAKDPAWLGVYPEYYDASADAENGGDRCIYSASFGTSPVGFIYRKDSAFDWSAHEDLAKYKIGVVQGYVNETRFDAMVADGSLKVDAGPTDASNVEKVAAGRMDAAVIDRNVFEHMLASEPRLAKHADALTFHEAPLATHDLLVCFENSDNGRAARDRFNSGLGS